VILDDGQLLTYGSIETGPNIVKPAQAVVEAAVHRRTSLWGEYRMPLPDVKVDHLRIEDMACIVSTGYGRAVVPFANSAITEISCHCRGAQWFVPGVCTVLDVGGQDTKGIRVGPNGEVADFAMNDKCAGGTGRFMEIVAEVLQVPLSEIGPLSLQSTKVLPFSSTCAAFGRGAAVAMCKEGERKEDILAGLHDSIAKRVLALVRKVGIADKFVISGGIGGFMEIVAEVLQVPLSEIGPLSLQSTKALPFSSTCAAFGRGAAVAMRKEGERKEDILAGLHESIAKRVMALVSKVGIADKFVISGGIGRNVGLVNKIEAKLGGLKVNLPQEPMIVGAVGAALFALDRARKAAKAGPAEPVAA
jgi:predicted CoA-substrate-specific enzyme activase